MTTEIQKIILQTYGTKTYFAQRMKICRRTAHKYFEDCKHIPFGIVLKICKDAKIEIKHFVKQSIQEDIYE